MSFCLLAIISANGSGQVVDNVRLALESSSAGWFRLVKYAGYAVALGCAMEAPETFITIKRWWLLRFRNIDKEETKEDRKHWAASLAAIGLLIIVLGIIVETFGEGKVSDVDALLRAHESDKITVAEGNAAAAIRDAGTAGSSAREAATASTTAQGASSTAVVLATGARKEADAFKNEIAAAKNGAADAVSHLADAEQRLADSTQREAAAEAKLSAIKTPRSLINTDRLVASIKPYAGTAYTINSFMDTESSDFAIIVARALDAAGWIRKQPPGINLGIPALTVTFDKKGEIVPSCIETGVSIHVPGTESDEKKFGGAPILSLPKQLQAGYFLHQQLGATISPPDEHNVGTALIDPRIPNGPIIICFGKKP